MFTHSFFRLRLAAQTALVAGCLLCAAAMASVPTLPNPATNPGALNPAVTQADIRQTICVRGWTKTVRPSFSYTNALKHRLLRRAGLSGRDIHDFELDHLVSLELGGAPSDPRNLWLEPWTGPWNAHIKDKLENRLNHLVCRGQLSLQAARDAIASNWIAAYKRYVSTSPPNWRADHNWHPSGHAHYRHSWHHKRYHKYRKWHHEEGQGQ